MRRSNVGLAASTSLASTNVFTNSAGEAPIGLTTSSSRGVTRTLPTKPGNWIVHSLQSGG